MCLWYSKRSSEKGASESTASTRVKICLNLKSSLQPHPLSPRERARERAANRRFALAVFSTCRLLFASFAASVLASQKPRFLQKLRFQTIFPFSAHRLCESVIGFDVSLRLTALSLTLSHGERGRVAAASLFAA